MKNKIYIYEGSNLTKKKRSSLILNALQMYIGEEELDRKVIEEVEVFKDQRGKPFFSNSNLNLSISHSGLMWMCLISPFNCGVDVQVWRNIDANKIARRFFTKEEADFVIQGGQPAFFNLWARKEAFVKTTGDGLFKDDASLAFAGSLVDQIVYKDRKYVFREIEMTKGLSCCMAFEVQKYDEPDSLDLSVEIRLLNGC